MSVSARAAAVGESVSVRAAAVGESVSVRAAAVGVSASVRMAAVLALLLGAACGGVPTSRDPLPRVPAPAPSPPVVARPAPPPEDAEAKAARAQVQAMLKRVAGARGLPVVREVPIRTLDRPAMLARIRKQVESDLPLDAIAAQGELLAAFNLVPPDYDFVAGTYALIEGQIAGFYMPSDGTMYLADDLGEDEAEGTLAHELVHALQDQSYALGPMLKYAPGESDRLTAVHALIEGDATSAMFDVVAGSAFNVSEPMLRRILALGAAFSSGGPPTPRVLQASLVAPYADGFAFVQGLRRRGGWKAVDDAYRAPPATTEQLLHLDKLDAREPALPLPVPPLAALGPGFRAVTDDVMGEQGLRIVLEDWTYAKRAREGASGWGGDRYVVALRDAPGLGGDPGPREIAAAWHIRFDTFDDAEEVSEILEAKLGGACRRRPETGPLVWKARGRDVVVVGGPYERVGQVASASAWGTCEVATKWADAILKGAPAVAR